MYQNFNCCSSDWMERTKYIQGRSGTKSKDCLPFVQYYKCLENKTENENIQYLHSCSAFSSPRPIGKFLPVSHTPFPTPSQEPQIPFHSSEKFCPNPPSRAVAYPIAISQLFLIPSLLTGSCATTPITGLGRERDHL